MVANDGVEGASDDDFAHSKHLKLERLRQCSVAATARRMSGLALASAAGRMPGRSARLDAETGPPASTINGQRPCRVTPGQRGPGDKQHVTDLMAGPLAGGLLWTLEARSPQDMKQSSNN